MTLTGTAVPLSELTAPRLRRPSWRDPRLLIGLVMLLTSVALGARVVALADHTEPVYAARVTLPSGTPLTSDALKVVRLRLTGTAAGYLDARHPLPAGQILVRPVGAGELVPLTSIASAGQLLVRPVSIPIDADPPRGLSPGGVVDLWASAKRRDDVGGGYDPPKQIAHAVEVFDLRIPGAGLSASRSGSVEVLLDSEELAPVLDALANQARVAVLPVPGLIARDQEKR
jgi:Flp pilus assembly protein CpaB